MAAHTAAQSPALVPKVPATRVATPRSHAGPDSRISILFHLTAGVWIFAMLLLGNTAPAQYQMLLQEDRAVEWATVCLFLTAGLIGLHKAVRERGLFDGLVALFCLFVAGEEFSWGQRLLGYYPPEFFLGNNFQQEFNLHNLPQSFLQPRWVLMIALGGYGIILPVLSRAERPRALMARVCATPPPFHVLPWFTAAIVLLLWYPLTLTGEWVEVFSGGLFLVSIGPPTRSFWIMLVLAASFGVAMTVVTDTLEQGRDADRIACAAAEGRSLVDDLTSGDAATSKLWQMRRVHKRIWSSIGERYLDEGKLRRFGTVVCAGIAGGPAGVRHKYGIDPWGSPYWLLVEKMSSDERRVSVYSFGPNRRRDVGAAARTGGEMGDDIVTTAIRHVKLD